MTITKALCAVIGLAGLESLSGCSVPLCDSSSYAGGTKICAASDWDLSVAMTQQNAVTGQQEPRFDVRRKDEPLLLSVVAARKSGGTRSTLSEVPLVEESQDGATFRSVSATMGMDKQSLLLLPRTRDQDLGPLEVQVTLPVSPEQEGTLSARTGGRVFRSPIFWDPPQALDNQRNPFGMTPVKGRTGVQVASPYGGKGQLLVSEQYLFGVDDRRWLDLYAANAKGEVDYYTSASWDLVQQQLVEATDAQLVLVKGAVMIYQTDSMSGRRELSLLPLSGARKSGLSGIPSNAKRLAGCAEDSVVALARPSEVLFFQTNPASMTAPIQALGMLSFPGTAEPVIATRDISAGSGVTTSKQYYAVIADAMGNLTLVELIRSGQVPSAVTSKPIGNAVTGGSAVTALALADLDSDGLQDIILATKDGALSWSPQQPDGSFKLAEPLSVRVPLTMGSGAFPIGLSVGDVTGDDIPDLAVATSEQRVFVYKNQ